MDQQEVREVIGGFFRREREDRVTRYKILNTMAKKGQTLFTGSSLMEQFPIHELLQDMGRSDVVYNRGVGGFTTADMLEHMEEQIFALEPRKIFINIGTNDINAGDYREEALIGNYRRILSQIKERLPQAKVYLMAYYPMNEPVQAEGAAKGGAPFGNRTNAGIERASAAVQALAEEFSYRFINVNDGLMDETGQLKREYTVEGIHMYANAYQVVLRNLLPYLDEN